MLSSGPATRASLELLLCPSNMEIQREVRIQTISNLMLELDSSCFGRGFCRDSLKPI
jgi:hypothetical protein